MTVSSSTQTRERHECILLACLHSVWARGETPRTLRSRATLQSESCECDTRGTAVPRNGPFPCTPRTMPYKHSPPGPIRMC